MVDMVEVAMPDAANFDFGNEPIPDNFLDETMEKAMTNHNRKESQIQSVVNDFQNVIGQQAAENIATNLIGYSYTDDTDDTDEKDRNIQNTVNRVMKTHKRKVSQFASLKQELGLVFDEEEAERIAKKTMKEMNPNIANVQQIQIQNIVNKARKEHKRKVSQFQAIRHDISQYFPDEEESTKLAAEIMKEYNPNKRSGKREEISIDSIVNKAVTEHRRKVSIFRAVENDLGLMFDDKDVKNITKDVMKAIFAQKHSSAHSSAEEQKQPIDVFDDGKKRRDSFDYLDEEARQKRQQRQGKHRRDSSVATPNIFADNYDPDSKVYVRQMQQQIQELQNELYAKDKEIEMMTQEISSLIESKTNLVRNSNQALDEMRGYLLQYQRSVFKTNS